MGIDIEVISREMIKPSTPTPHHLRHHHLSFLDQSMPPTYISLIYFFNNDQKLSSNDISKALKLSLSNLLTYYYPLAGCVNDIYVDCNDDGVLFLEAKLSCQLSQIIKEPVLPNELSQFLPYLHKEDTNVVNDLALAIQVNFFNCGGVAICAHMCHKVGDGSSFITFVKNWAAIALGHDSNDNNICPELVGATLFPPKETGGFDTNTSFAEKNIVIKRFVFSGSMIAALREKYGDSDATNCSSDKGIYPTRIEALTTFIWSRFASSTQIKSESGSEKTCMFIHTVNLRKRMYRPLADDCFGSIVGAAVTIFSHDPREECNSYGLVRKLRDSIKKINKDYVEKLQGDANDFINLRSMVSEGSINKGDLVTFSYSSLCRYPVYEADFGWGRPQWVAWGGCFHKNLAVFMDTKCGQGIDAWIHLNQEDMAKFETDKELLAFVSPIS